MQATRFGSSQLPGSRSSSVNQRTAFPAVPRVAQLRYAKCVQVRKRNTQQGVSKGAATVSWVTNPLFTNAAARPSSSAQQDPNTKQVAEPVQIPASTNTVQADGPALRGAFAWVGASAADPTAALWVRLAAMISEGLVLAGAALSGVLLRPFALKNDAHAASPSQYTKYDGISAFFMALGVLGRAAQMEQWGTVPPSDPLRTLFARLRPQDFARAVAKQQAPAAAAAAPQLPPILNKYFPSPATALLAAVPPAGMAGRSLRTKVTATTVASQAAAAATSPATAQQQQGGIAGRDLAAIFGLLISWVASLFNGAYQKAQRAAAAAIERSSVAAAAEPAQAAVAPEAVAHTAADPLSSNTWTAATRPATNKQVAAQHLASYPSSEVVGAAVTILSDVVQAAPGVIPSAAAAAAAPETPTAPSSSSSPSSENTNRANSVNSNTAQPVARGAVRKVVLARAQFAAAAEAAAESATRDTHASEPYAQLMARTSPEALAAALLSFKALMEPQYQALRQKHSAVFTLLVAADKAGEQIGIPAWRTLYLPGFSAILATAKRGVPALVRELRAQEALRPLSTILTDATADEVVGTLAALVHHFCTAGHVADLPVYVVDDHSPILRIANEAEARAALAAAARSS